MSSEELKPEVSQKAERSGGEEEEKFPEGTKVVSDAEVKNWYEALRLVSPGSSEGKRMRFPILIEAVGEGTSKLNKYVVTDAEKLRAMIGGLEHQLRQGGAQMDDNVRFKLTSKYGDYDDLGSRIIKPEDSNATWPEGTEVVEDAVVGNVEEALALVDSKYGGEKRLPSGPLLVIEHFAKRGSKRHIVNTKNELIEAIEAVRFAASENGRPDAKVHLISKAQDLGDTSSQTITPPEPIIYSHRKSEE